jgi:hypothetical protein
MWTTIDTILLAATVAAGQPYALPLAYTAGATLDTIALLKRGRWIWGWVETVSAIGATVAMVMWKCYDAEKSIIAAVLAMNIAGIQLLIDMVRKPVPGTLPVWALTCVASVLTLLGSDGSLSGTLLAWSGLNYNAILSALCLRKYWPIWTYVPTRS